MVRDKINQKSYLPPLAFIGFGEAARAFVSGIRSEQPSITISAFDIKTNSECVPVRHAKFEDYEKAAVTGAETSAEAIVGTNIIFSTVTADQAFVAANNSAKAIAPSTLYLDCNSCSPATKRRSAEAIHNAGGKYVDVAIMAPVAHRLHKTPLLLAGPHTAEAYAILRALGMDAETVTGDIGSASAVKMIRSIMIKGLEGLVAECVLAGRKAGVDELVLASLDKTFPGFDWPKRSAYMLDRMLEHGTRRAAEMREVVSTIADLGLDPTMSSATVKWQEALGSLGSNLEEIKTTDYANIADAILFALEEDKTRS